ncbi:MAG: preprotein translocase subunit YajC [Lachnospiraceae bacterium]|nr:preprotein translocase subunit YajC [Lachnospiraceae bacterium]
MLTGYGLLLTENAGAATGGAVGVSYIISIVAMVAIFYFFLLRPQKKEQKKIQEMLQAMEVGDVVVTTSGFYGVLIDITEEDVIVEFGSNKNCRIPMRKSAIAQVEKAEK